MPTWSAPYWLWLLLLVPVYFLLHLLLQTVQNQPFSSLRIWKRVRQVLNQAKQNTFSIKNVITSMLLSLLLAGLFFALAGPVTTHITRKDNLHFLIDMSASMKIENDRGLSRYQRALRKIEQLVDQSSHTSNWTVTLLTIPLKTREGPPSELLKFLKDNTPADLSYQRSLSKYVDSFGDQTDETLVLITDSTSSNPSTDTKNLHRFTVGTTRKNTGIISLRGTRNGPSLELMIQLAHHGSEEQPVQIELLDQEGNVRKTSSHVISSASTPSVHMQIDEWNETQGRVHIDMNAPDALSQDNTAVFAAHAPYRIRTRISGKQNQHVLQLLSSISPVHPVEDGPDVTFAYRPTARDTRRLWDEDQKAVLIDPVIPEDLPFETTQPERIRSPDPRNHVLVDHLSFRKATIQSARTLKQGSNVRSIIPLITHRNQPLVFLKQRPEPQLWMLFDPFVTPGESLKSNWSVQPDLYPGFVQFWQNVFEYFQPLNIKYRNDIVYWKTGEWATKAQYRPSEPVDRRTNRTGMHTISVNRSTKPLPVNLTSRSETNTILANSESEWSSIQNESEEVTETEHTDTLSRALLFLFLLSLIFISLLHRASRTG